MLLLLLFLPSNDITSRCRSNVNRISFHKAEVSTKSRITPSQSSGIFCQLFPHFLSPHVLLESTPSFPYIVISSIPTPHPAQHVACPGSTSNVVSHFRFISSVCTTPRQGASASIARYLLLLGNSYPTQKKNDRLVTKNTIGVIRV